MSKVNLKETFEDQIKKTRLLTEEDFLAPETGNPVIWNGMVFAPENDTYSSGKPMKPGDKLLVGYVVDDRTSPSPVLVEESELDFYSDKLKVVRIVESNGFLIPVLEKV